MQQMNRRDFLYVAGAAGTVASATAATKTRFGQVCWERSTLMRTAS
ncbi:twin-arginine translocation signal domain-containing protein [Acidobacteria bacterium AH-259-A15]|nr:twin-arginine translocation signal domain-containing protein [Acidobacteria bacterium AH-259-A15]